MSSESIVTLVAAGLAFVASLGAIYIGRFRRFAQERWWDRQADAYTRIIEALSDVVAYYREMLDEELNPKRSISDEEEKERWKRSKKGHEQVNRAADIGAFLISTEAEAALQLFRRGSGKKIDPNDWYSLYDDAYCSAENCLRALVECAKRDLRV